MHGKTVEILGKDYWLTLKKQICKRHCIRFFFSLGLLECNIVSADVLETDWNGNNSGIKIMNCKLCSAACCRQPLHGMCWHRVL